jgi:23S rRNA pseudouridine1911/1915/1917 synthase
VDYEEPAPEPAEPCPENLPLAIVHEDPHLIVLEKPAGQVVHPGAGSTRGTLVNALLFHCHDLSGIGGIARPGIVHRLDKGTSGLIVVAKDDVTHRELSRQFADREVEKEYLAIVIGRPRANQGEITTSIGRHPTQRKKMSTRTRRPRTAHSSYTVEERLDGAALLRVRIHTGRTHQIRVHLASLGHPVAGDRTYGGTRPPPCSRSTSREAIAALGRPALHAARLSFAHPVTGHRLELSSGLPQDLAELAQRLRFP